MSRAPSALSRRILAVVAVSAALLGACSDGGNGTATTTSSDTTSGVGGAGTSTSTTVDAATSIDVVVTKGAPEGGVRDVTVKRGTTVRLHVEADITDEVHIHGYDLHGDVAPGSPAIVEFTADLAGKFEIEIEKAGFVIAQLTVT